MTTSMERIEKLERDVQDLTYLHAELSFKFEALLTQLRTMMLQQAMQQPEVQQALIKQALERMNGSGGLIPQGI